MAVLGNTELNNSPICYRLMRKRHLGSFLWGFWVFYDRKIRIADFGPYFLVWKNSEDYIGNWGQEWSTWLFTVPLAVCPLYWQFLYRRCDYMCISAIASKGFSIIWYVLTFVRTNPWNYHPINDIWYYVRLPYCSYKALHIFELFLYVIWKVVSSMFSLTL